MKDVEDVEDVEDVDVRCPCQCPAAQGGQLWQSRTLPKATPPSDAGLHREANLEQALLRVHLPPATRSQSLVYLARIAEIFYSLMIDSMTKLDNQEAQEQVGAFCPSSHQSLFDLQLKPSWKAIMFLLPESLFRMLQLNTLRILTLSALPPRPKTDFPGHTPGSLP